jgi:Domain of unknown function (DUF4279)
MFELDLILRGEQLDPASVSTLLGVTPTRTRTRGERNVTGSGRPYETKVSVWRLKAEGVSPSACVAALASRLGGEIPELSHLPGVEDAFLDLFVTFEPGRGEGDELRLEWEPAALEQLARFQLPLLITFAVVGAEDALLTEPPTDESVLF